MESCIFCKISNGEIPSDMVYSDEDFFVIKDIKPMAKIHLLVIPKNHIIDITAVNDDTIKKAFDVINYIAKEQNLEAGFRVITNIGFDGGQTVPHLHFHILAGEKLSENLN